MAKVSASKLFTVKKIDPINININGQEIIVIQYLPTDEKSKFLAEVLTAILDETGYVNPMRQELYTALYILKYYTNINITDSMMNAPEKTYDLFKLNGIIEQIYNAIPSEELSTVLDVVDICADNIVNYNTSFAGNIKAVANDYSATQLDVDAMMQQVQSLKNEENTGLLQEVLEKMG